MTLTKKILRPVVGVILSALVAAFVLWIGPIIFTPEVGLAVLFLAAAVGCSLLIVFAIDKFIDFILWLFADD